MRTPDISQQAVYHGGNSVFDKVHILDELVYDFTKSGTLSINSVGVCTFTKVNTDQLDTVNSNVVTGYQIWFSYDGMSGTATTNTKYTVGETIQVKMGISISE